MVVKSGDAEDWLFVQPGRLSSDQPGLSFKILLTSDDTLTSNARHKVRSTSVDPDKLWSISNLGVLGKLWSLYPRAFIPQRFWLEETLCGSLCNDC